MIYTFFQIRFIQLRMAIAKFPKAPHKGEEKRGCWCFETYAEAEDAARYDEKNRATDETGQTRMLVPGELNLVVGLECNWDRDTTPVTHKLFGPCRELTKKGVIILELPQ